MLELLKHFDCIISSSGLPQQIQLRAMISQSSSLPRVAGTQLQPMQAQVNLQAGTVVMQPQQQQQQSTAVATSTTISTTGQQQQQQQSVQVVSSLAQQQQRNIQAAVQKQILQQQQQQQMKLQAVTISSAVLTKPTQVGFYLKKYQLFKLKCW